MIFCHDNGYLNEQPDRCNGTACKKWNNKEKKESWRCFDFIFPSRKEILQSTVHVYNIHASPVSPVFFLNMTSHVKNGI